MLILQGETLAKLVRRIMPPMQGTVELRAVTWRARALIDLLTDRPTPLLVEGLRVTDPEGAVVLDVPHLEVKVRPRSAMRGQIRLSDLVVSGPASWRFAAMRGQNGNDGNNGFLSSFAPRPRDEARQANTQAAPPGAEPFVFEIRNAKLDGLTAVFDFPAWGLELRDIVAPASLLVDGDFVGWDVADLDARGGGFLRILADVLPFDRVWVNRVATTRDWPDRIFLDLKAARTGRSTLRGKGFFNEIYGYGYRREPEPGIDMQAEIEDAADALAAVVAARALPGVRIGGQKARVSLGLRDAFSRLRINADVSGLDVGLGAYQALALGLRASLLVDPLQASLEDFGFSPPGGGRFKLGATFENERLRARLRFERFVTDSYVPVGLRRLAAGRLDGQLAVAANLGEAKHVAVNSMSLTLTRARAGGLPRSARLAGQVSASAKEVSTSGLVLEVPGASAELRGEVQLARRLLALGLKASTSDLPRLLRSVGVAPLARGAALSVEVGGRLDAPEAHGEAVVHGIAAPALPEVPVARARFRLADGTLVVDSLTAQVAGGTIDGRGQLKIFAGTIARMLRSPVLSFRLEGREVDLYSLLAVGVVHGKLSFAATASGPLSKLRARLEVPPGSSVEVLGAEWDIAGIDVEVDAKTLVVRLARLERKTGARIEIAGQMTFGGAMTWKLAIRDVALEGLPGIAGNSVPVTGRLSADLEATGDLSRPRIVGSLRLADVVARGARLGDGSLTLSPAPDAGMAVTGSLFRRFEVDGSIAFGSAGPRAEVAVSFANLALQDLLPELAAMGDGRGIATGRVSVTWRPDAPLAVDARLSDLGISINREAIDQAGKRAPQRIWVRSSGPLHAALAGDRITLDPAKLVTDGGEFGLRGEMAGGLVAGSLSGHLNLDLLQPFLRRQVTKLTGDVAVDLNVSGPVARPIVEGKIAVGRPVRLQAVGFTSELVVPSGAVRLGRGFVELADLALTIDGATLKVEGSARFDQDFKPTTMDIEAAGEVSATVLEAVAPGAVSDTSGRARIRARLAGSLAAPTATGRVDLGGITLRLRDLGRQVKIESGAVELTNRELVIRDLRTRIDDQGKLLVGADGLRPGRIAIKSLFPKLEIGEVSVPLKGERLTYREPDSFEIDDLAMTVALTGNPQDGLRLGGEVLLMSGRYVNDFAVRGLVVSRRLREASFGSGGGEPSLLSAMALDLRVRTVGDSLVIQNNLAPEIHVLVDLRITGTPVAPRIAGSARPTDGRFHIIGLRGDFELVPNVNHITFVDTKSIAAGDTPELNLEATNLFTDSAGNDRVVRMRIRGPVNQAAIELSSDDGLDRNQALLLLVSGRTTNDLTRLGTTQNPTLGSNVRSGTELVGQLTRDTVSNFVEPYIDDTLQLLTGRKVNLRPTVGADGFELRLDARVTRKIDLELSMLRGFQDNQRYRAELNIWPVDYSSVRLFVEQLTFNEQPGITENATFGNLELMFEYPLRLFRP